MPMPISCKALKLAERADSLKTVKDAYDAWDVYWQSLEFTLRSGRARKERKHGAAWRLAVNARPGADVLEVVNSQVVVVLELPDMTTLGAGHLEDGYLRRFHTTIRLDK